MTRLQEAKDLAKEQIDKEDFNELVKQEKIRLRTKKPFLGGIFNYRIKIYKKG